MNKLNDGTLETYQEVSSDRDRLHNIYIAQTIEISKLKDEITTSIIKEVAQGRLRWSSCSNQQESWKEPYIKCDNAGHGKSFVDKLAAKGVESAVDLYEDDDGDDGRGRSIIRKIWSVRLTNQLKITV